MLVTFETEVHANITMFGEVAVTLLKLMGQSGAIPGAILGEDVPAALARLRQAVAEHAQEPLDPATPPGAKDDREGQQVSVGQRALPLLGLLQAAATAGKNVMWASP